jgi:GT2 family glycosyltransferase
MPAELQPLVSVIIPTAGSRELLVRCLSALEEHEPAGIQSETIVVLNGAIDLQELERWPSLRLLQPQVNLGIAAACNAARRIARGAYLILLHDDTEVEKGWLEGLVATATEHQEAGAIGCRVLHMDGTLQAAGWVLWQDGSTSPPWVGEPPPPPESFCELRAVDYCGTCSLLVRASTWDAVGGLDEQFFPAYYVDVDFCLAVRRRGEAVYCTPSSTLRHHRGASGNRRFREFLTARNRTLFLAKWGSLLDSQEPPERSNPQAIERALARAERGVTRKSSVGDPDPPPRTQRSLEQSEFESLRREADVRRAFSHHLEAILETTLRTQAANLADEAGELRRRAATLEAIESSHFWRLYQRLLPMLRWLRGPTNRRQS